jgi:hypothetical protein
MSVSTPKVQKPEKQPGDSEIKGKSPSAEELLERSISKEDGASYDSGAAREEG